MLPFQRKIFTALLAVLSLSLLATTPLWAAGYSTVPLPDSGSAIVNFQIYNDHVLWQKQDASGNYQLFLYDGTKTVQLYNCSAYIWAFQLNNGQVAWQGLDGNSYQAFLYDGTKTIQLGSSAYGDVPQINNGQVIWRGEYDDNGNYPISLYDGTKTIQIGNNGYKAVQINNGQAGWEGTDVYPQLYLYDIAKATTIQVTHYVGSQYMGSFQLNNGEAVWNARDANGIVQIYLYDSATAATIQLTHGSYNSSSAQLNNGQVVWQGYDGHYTQLFLYDIAKAATIQLTQGSQYMGGVQINNGQVVWGGRDTNGNSQIFLYDVAKAATAQVTQGNPYIGAFRINNGQVAWSGRDANGSWQIYIYDIATTATIPLTTGIYNSTYFQISNGYVTWRQYDATGAYSLSLAKPQLQSLEILDGSDFSIGTKLSTDTTKLATGGVVMNGAVTDGVTRLLLRMQVSDTSPVTFSATGASNNPLHTDNGLLQDINGQDNPQNVQSIQVTPVNVNGTNYVFAVYQAPGHFVRKGINQTGGVDGDTLISERIVTLTAQTDSQTLATQDIKLDRPPLLLIHGLWAGPSMWTGGDDGSGYNFFTNLTSQINGLQVYKVDYSNQNSYSLATNSDVPYSCSYVNQDTNVKSDNIKDIKAKFKAKQIAITQVDIVGHSMGGLLARIWAKPTPEAYIRDDNFRVGDIHELITLDSPHYGSFLADLGQQFIKDFNSTPFPWAVNASDFSQLNVDANALFVNLVQNGYINASGIIQNKFRLLAGYPDLLLDAAYAGQKQQIYTILSYRSYQLGWALAFVFTLQAMDNGALGDLTTTSDSIRSLNSNDIIPKCHAIAGDYIVSGGDLNLIPGYVGGLLRRMTELGYNVIPFVVTGSSDLVVSLGSQFGGINSEAASEFNHQHTEAATPEVAADVIKLLNSNETDNLFTDGFKH